MLVMSHCNCDPLWKNRPFTRKYDFAGQGSKVAKTFFFQIFFLSFCESMIFSVFINFHRNIMLFNYCDDREKEGTRVLASYVHGLTVIIDQ